MKTTHLLIGGAVVGSVALLALRGKGAPAPVATRGSGVLLQPSSVGNGAPPRSVGTPPVRKTPVQIAPRPTGDRAAPRSTANTNPTSRTSSLPREVIQAGYSTGYTDNIYGASPPSGNTVRRSSTTVRTPVSTTRSPNGVRQTQPQPASRPKSTTARPQPSAPRTSPNVRGNRYVTPKTRSNRAFYGSSNSDRVYGDGF